MTTHTVATEGSSLEQALALVKTLDDMLELEFEQLKAQNLDAF